MPNAIPMFLLYLQYKMFSEKDELYSRTNRCFQLYSLGKETPRLESNPIFSYAFILRILAARFLIVTCGSAQGRIVLIPIQPISVLLLVHVLSD